MDHGETFYYENRHYILTIQSGHVPIALNFCTAEVRQGGLYLPLRFPYFFRTSAKTNSIIAV